MLQIQSRRLFGSAIQNTLRPSAMLLRATLILFLSTVGMLAQQSSIGGQVTDATGAPLAGAKVVAVNNATNVANNGVTNESGEYLIPNLEVGEYTVSIEHEGFRKFIETKLVLDTAEKFGLTVKMEIGSVSETVTVSAKVAKLDDQTSEISQVFEPAELADIPLGDRRTLHLVNLMPGAVLVDYVTGAKPNFSLAGGRTQSQMLWIDGGSAQNMRLGVGQVDVDPPVEAVDQVKILTNNYSAEYGGSAGGVILETTKSGGNAYHGSAWEFLRNDAFNAPGFFAPVINGQKTLAELRYNIYGVTFGGPIRKNRTFFFFSYEGRKLGVGASLTLTVPTLPQRTGDFSQTTSTAGALIPIYDPHSSQLVAGKYTRTQYPGNIIPQSQLDPVALKMLNYYPLPNRPATNAAGANNFATNTITWTDSNFYMAKIDHVFSEKDRITGRYLFNQDYPTVHGPYGPNDAGDPTAYTNARQQYVYANEIHIFDPSTVNDVRFTFGYRGAPAFTNGVGSKAIEAIGLPGVSDNAFPHLAPAGFSALGSTSQERDQLPIENLQLVDNFSKIVGRHALKFGVEARKSANFEVDKFTASGDFTFSTQSTNNGSAAAGGNGMASMLVGYPTTFNEANTQPINRSSWYYSAFAQDDFTVSRNLTVNIGVRWEMDTPMVDENNRLNGFSLSQINPVSNTPGVVTFAGLNGMPSNPWHYNWKTFGPRFGFAWKPEFLKKVVVRGGYGIFYAHPFDSGQPASANLGFSTNLALTTPDNGITPVFILKNGPPALSSSTALTPSYGAVPYGATPNTAVTYFDPSRVSGYSQQSNLNVQYQISGSMIVEVTSITNIGHHLANTNLPINQIAPSVLGPNCSTQICRPFPQFSNVTILSPSIGDSRYIAGFVRLSKRFSGGLNLNLSYTQAEFLDNSFEGGSALGTAAPYANQYNRAPDWGPSGNDIRSHFTFGSVYELPLGTGKRWLSNGIAGNVAGGWTLGTVVSVQSGPPINVTTTTNNTNSFSTAQHPNVVGNSVLPSDQRTVNQWFNTAAFAQPAIYTFGNAARNDVRAPGLFDIDLSLGRTFSFGERIKLQFRGEAFNVLNHTNLKTPNGTFGGAAFGTITASGPARVLQVGATMRF